MKPLVIVPATVCRPSLRVLLLSGMWTARGIGPATGALDALNLSPGSELDVDGGSMGALDTVGACVLLEFQRRLEGAGVAVQLRNLRPEFARLLELVRQNVPARTAIAPRVPVSALEGLGRNAGAAVGQAIALCSFVGEGSMALGACLAHPARFRWRPVLFNIRSAGLDALPIVGLLSFLLGVVVAYQGAGQLRQYGANIFVVDLVGLSMLREFAPLMTAIIIAGRSGSAWAAQIGTMAVTEEIDAMSTLGIRPLELLVVPKLIALLVALPLLTVFADVLGVSGGMVMAHTRLGVGYGEFLDRFAANIDVAAFLVGVGKAPVFAVIIATVGCFQGFCTHGGADSVGRQTTRSVVQSIFLVIVADALFSIAFSVLDL